MKTLCIFFFVLTLSGCSSHSLLYSLLDHATKEDLHSAKNIFIYTHDSVAIEYAVLSVRGDTAIVVIDPEEIKHPDEISYSRAVVVNKNSHRKIVEHIKGGKPATIGLISGLVIGTMAAFAVHEARPKYDGWDPFSTNYLEYAILPLLFGGVGNWIGNSVTSEVELSLSSSDDRKKLKSFSLFPFGEPAIMQYLR
jgi:hypothetical protein